MSNCQIRPLTYKPCIQVIKALFQTHRLHGDCALGCTHGRSCAHFLLLVKIIIFFAVSNYLSRLPMPTNRTRNRRKRGETEGCSLTEISPEIKKSQMDSKKKTDPCLPSQVAAAFSSVGDFEDISSDEGNIYSPGQEMQQPGLVRFPGLDGPLPAPVLPVAVAPPSVVMDKETFVQMTEVDRAYQMYVTQKEQQNTAAMLMRSV